MKALLHTPDDRDAFLADNLDNFLTQLQARAGLPQFSPLAARTATSWETNCGYDPVATAKLIAEILQNPCVKKVYVPDFWLISRFEGETTKITYKPFLEDDRFTVETSSQSCSPAGDAP
ncbi:MAG: hypothetical protein NDJ89_06600 [Oligoflexia bacterium]|nr:hypothetical protein [Oligoflexia bacterium]